VESQYLTLISDTQYPIVKIGTGYWTRQNIQEYLYFVDDDGFPMETILEGLYYANIFYTNSSFVTSETQGNYGNAVDATTKERTQWYLPKQKDINNLYTYIELNPKAMLKQQASGFDAEFLGAYGPTDDITGKYLGEYQFRYKNKYCFIACKDEETSQSGTALVLSTDYQLFKSKLTQASHNEYPIRLFRTAYWKYSDKY
jgi:hypothetical protein